LLLLALQGFVAPEDYTIRLRQVLASNPYQPWALVHDESYQIQNVSWEQSRDFSSKIHIRLENKPLPSIDQVELFVSFKEDLQSALILESSPVLVPLTLTLSQLKTKVLLLAGSRRKPSEFIFLKRTSLVDKGKVCMNEHFPLKNLKLSHGSLMLLQPGQIPVKDTIVLELNHYVSPSIDFRKCWDTLEKRFKKSTECVSQTVAQIPFSSICTVPVSKTLTLIELKHFVHELPYFKEICKSPYHLRIRLLHNRTMLGRVIPCDEKTIGTKAQGLTKDSAIAITVLDEQEKELSQYSMFIRLVV